MRESIKRELNHEQDCAIAALLVHHKITWHCTWTALTNGQLEGIEGCRNLYRHCVFDYTCEL